MSKEMRQYDQKIIECTYDPKQNKWDFLRVREDKSFPNHITTANGKRRTGLTNLHSKSEFCFPAVFKGIVNPLTKDRLIELIDNSNAALTKTQNKRGNLPSDLQDSDANGRPSKLLQSGASREPRPGVY